VKISGEATLYGSVDRVYEALHDPAVLVRAIPGCERLERVGPDAYTMAVSAGVAAIRGTYSGEVVLADRRAPHEFVLKASGAGAPGTVSAEATVRLTEGADGTTALAYDADAVIGGVVGGVGQRVLAGVARKQAAEFFDAVNGILAGTAVTEAPAVFTRPAAVAARGGDFTTGVLVGAGAALLGVVIGALAARRPRSGRG
jgi:carbon monoxide dehydrogenase subunit G